MHAISYVRFSTPEQAKGDSYQRQVSQSEAYCRNKGLTLLPEGFYFDKGVSAFRGANKITGQLAQILADAQAGNIPKGTRLIVESLDRLGRDGVMSQLGFFIALLKAGLVIVTLGANVAEYDENTDFTLLISALVIMSRANEESATKSMRSKSVWESKRKNMKNVPITGNVPGWLKTEGTKIVGIPARVKIVKEIFDLAQQGFGRRVIANKLNEKKIPVFGTSKSRLWHDTYVGSILKNRSVLGEFAPQKRELGKKVSLGETIADYYPAVIDEETFLTVQHRMASRVKSGGRATYKAGNLFSGRLKCFCCGSPMHFADKGRNYRYLNCSTRILSRSCISSPCPYDATETAILKEMTQIDWQAIMSPDNSKSVSDQTAALKAKIAELDVKINNLTNVLADGTVKVDAIVEKLTTLDAERKSQAATLAQLIETTEIKNRSRHMADEAAKEAVKFLHLAENKNTRLSLKKHIDDLLLRSYVAFDGGFKILMIFSGGGLGFVNGDLSYKFEVGAQKNEASLKTLLSEQDLANLKKWEPQLFE